MRFQYSFFGIFLSSLVALMSPNALAIEDICTPELNAYLEKAEKIVDTKYISSSKKKSAQAIIDKVKASRNETHDCILVDKLLP